MDQLVKTNKRAKIQEMIVGFVVFVFAFFLVQQLFFTSPSLDKKMMQIANEINKTCPIMIDEDTRFDNAVALPDNIFQYNFTLVNLEKQEIELDTVKKYLEPNIINNAKTNPDLKMFRDHKITINYNYHDKNGVFVVKISVKPEIYSTSND
jgi:hypothetical protein